MPDVDMNRTVGETFMAAFSNAGQNCCAGSRLLLHRDIHDEFLERLKHRAKQAKLGREPGCDYGALIDAPRLETVKNAIKLGKEVSTLIIGGDQLSEPGYLFPPTIFAGVPDASPLAKEEIFGPVLSVLPPFDTLDEAILRANDTKYGLAAGVFTKDIKTAERCVRELKVGTVWVNTYNGTYGNMPFGGRGLSGFGKDLGEEGLEEFLETKAVNVWTE